MATQETRSLPSTFANLFDQMQRARIGPPDSLLQSLRTLPPVKTLPTPWETWLLAALIEYREDQDCGRLLLMDHLPQAVPPCDDFCERDQPIEGDLPRMPDWKYTVECGVPQFATLTNRNSGEVLIVDIGVAGDKPFTITGALFEDFWPGSRHVACSRLLELTPAPANGTPQIDPKTIDGLVEARLLKCIEDDWPLDG